MKNETFYIPIKSANLAHYFVKGCICPSLYIQNRVDDIQNYFDSYILLSTSKFTANNNCSLEIVLDVKTEITNKISDNFYLFDNVLPISRIKRIFFADEQQKTNTIFNITSGAAFLPLDLITVETNTDSISIKELEGNKIEKSQNNWQSKLEIFNRLLGGFAVMKIAKDEVENYSENYFDTLAVISNVIGNELQNQSLKISDKYKWAIFKGGKYSQLNELIFSPISESVLMSYAKEEGISIKKENGKYKLNSKDEHSKTYLISILASYGEGARMSIDNFVSDLNSNKFPKERNEGIGLIFGINKGYETFRNKYETSNFQVDVKFKLDSILDYYTIETIYQYTFNGKISNDKFEYLDNWIPKFNQNIKSSKFETFIILDKVIITKKKDKIELPSYFKSCFQNTSRDKIYEIILSEINKLLPSYILEKNTKEGLEYFKNLLEDEFEKYSMVFSNQIKLNLNIENDKTNSLNTLELTNKIELLEADKKTFIDKINSKNKEIEMLKSELELFKNSQFINKNTLEKEKQNVEKVNIEVPTEENYLEETPIEYKNEKVTIEESIEEIKIEEKTIESKNEKAESKPIKKVVKKAAAKKGKSSDDLTMFPNV
jgi:hypothetical protein